MSEENVINVKPEPATDDASLLNFMPQDSDFDEDIGLEEREHYKNKYKDLNDIKQEKLHCTSCDKHLGCAPRNESRMRQHPMLRTLVCQACHTFYNSGEFEKGDDGSELYCRWCGQGGQVYCCSDCPHVFCAKCIRRNLGVSKIKEIESTDDWKCFKCVPGCLWDLRALCWALLHYCDIKNKLAYKTEDPDLKEKYQKECAIDDSDCCKDKKRRISIGNKKKEDDIAKKSAAAISKIPPTIQVKKFASIILDDQERKAEKRKRSASPLKTYSIKNPIAIAPALLPPVPTSLIRTFQPNKKSKIAIPHNPIIVHNPLKVVDKRPQMKPRIPMVQIRQPIPTTSMFNGFNVSIPNDNINLTLESLTQGLDMATVASMAVANANKDTMVDDNVVCTPDFPMEPLCEVTEDNNDDDVECITPGPIAPPISVPHPAPQKIQQNLPDLSPENIIQMTGNDVTVNAMTGGLKFRVDPQTLSSNKMYRLPDGRIFAINANANMPGGYSATIVAVSDSKSIPGKTFAAKVSAVTAPPPPQRLTRKETKDTPNKSRKQPRKSAPITTASTRVTRATSSTVTSAPTPMRDLNMKVPIEWYRYNLIDAVDTVEYSLSRLHKLKKDATTVYLRTRTAAEIRKMHSTLERLLNTSAMRFQEVRENLNRDFKEYLKRKDAASEDEEDDDIEILSTDDPICIDENSLDSIEMNTNDSTAQEVDLSSDNNEITDKNKGSDPFKNIVICDISSQHLRESDKHADQGENVSNINNLPETHNFVNSESDGVELTDEKKCEQSREKQQNHKDSDIVDINDKDSSLEEINDKENNEDDSIEEIKDKEDDSIEEIKDKENENDIIKEENNVYDNIEETTKEDNCIEESKDNENYDKNDSSRKSKDEPSSEKDLADEVDKLLKDDTRIKKEVNVNGASKMEVDEVDTKIATGDVKENLDEDILVDGEQGDEKIEDISDELMEKLLKDDLAPCLDSMQEDTSILSN